ncbi:MAG: PAS domain-containing protein, partial [Acidimicrobiales bacterium]|nr:PAS domain-containing protein [Acidimicrobiales bacterium]
MADAPAPTDGGRSGRGRTRAAPGIDPRTAALVEHLSETVFLVGDDGEAGLRLGPSVGPLGFGVDEEDGGPVHVAERVHPDDLLTVLGLIDEVRRTPGLRTTVHVRARHKDGSWRRIEAVIASVVDDPDVRGALMRIRDVTGSDDAAARGPRAGEGGEPGDVGARFRSLAEAVPSGILCADGRGSVVFSNEAAHRILECPAARLLGRGWSEAVLAEDRDEVVAAARSVLGDEGSAEATFRVAGAAGTRWVHARFVPL